MLLLVILFPFLGFLIGAFFGRFLGAKGVTLVTTFFIGLSFLFSIYAFIHVAFSQKVFIYTLVPWFSTSMLDVYLGFYGGYFNCYNVCCSY